MSLYFKMADFLLITLDCSVIYSLVDVRSLNISEFNLENYEDGLQYIKFDTDTICPDALLTEFDPQINTYGRRYKACITN